jgi:hypothetical protein
MIPRIFSSRTIRKFSKISWAHELIIHLNKHKTQPEADPIGFVASKDAVVWGTRMLNPYHVSIK